MARTTVIPDDDDDPLSKVGADAGDRGSPGRGAGSHGALPEGHPLRDGRTTAAPVLVAYRGRRPSRRPIWMMRQAGRSLPEYRRARAGTAMLDACLTPHLAAELTLQPVRRHGVDAAILFSDIVVPLRLAGVGVDIVAGRGPVLDAPIRSAADVAHLPTLDPAALEPIAHAARLTVAELGGTPLIGFAGAPFTVASYMVEGGSSRDHLRTRAMMHSDPAAWHELAGWVARVALAFLRAQVLAGASAVQLFDSWAGVLPKADYRRLVAPHTRTVFDGLAELGVPRVHFGVGTGEILAEMAAAGTDVMGIDHRITLDEANRRLDGRFPLQGNIDPALLLAGGDALTAHARAVLAAGDVAPAHVVNLGHGVPPDADPGVLTALVEMVHEIPVHER